MQKKNFTFQCCYLVDGEIRESTTRAENDGAGHHGSLEGSGEREIETNYNY